MFPSGEFAVLILQIPVVCGHHGGDLTVRHEVGSTTFDRQEDSSRAFYLSISYLDNQHEFSPVTEGWSLAMTFKLKWKKPVQVPSTFQSLPLYMANLNTVRHILKEMSPEKTQACDTDMLVIPLKNSYTKITLSYSHLKGTDKLMTSLLQGINYLEVRLIFALRYRCGLVAVQREVNRNRQDEGYPESDCEEHHSSNGSNNRRMHRLLEQNHSIEKCVYLNGSAALNTIPIWWSADYIHGSINDLEDIFDISNAAPTIEEFDGYNRSVPVLKQKFYKPMLVFWPKDSRMIKYRSPSLLPTMLSQLKKTSAETNWTSTNENERKAKILELRSVVNYIHRLYLKHGYFYSQSVEEISSLLQVCNSLKAKEEALFLYKLNLNNNHGSGWSNLKVLDPMAEFIGFFGWEDSKKFIGAIVRSMSTASDEISAANRFILPLIAKLLLRDEPTRNEAAFTLFQRACHTVFQKRTETAVNYEIFSRLLPLNITTSSSNFFISLLVLEHRRLFRRNSKWIPMTIAYLKNLPIEQIRSTVVGLSESSFLQDLSIGQMTAQCRNLLEMLCQRYLTLDLRYEDSHFICQLGKLFVFMEDEAILRQLINKILDEPPGIELRQNHFLRRILNCYYCYHRDSDFMKKVRSICMKRLTHHRQDLIETLKVTVETQMALGKGPESKVIATALNTAIPYFISNQPLRTFLAEEDFKIELPNILYLFKLCNDLKSKEKGLKLFRAFAQYPAFNWCDNQVMEEVQRFVSFAGWTAAKVFIDAILRRMSGNESTLSFLTKLEIALLSSDEPLSKVAAGLLFPQLLLKLFSQSATNISKTKFSNRISTLQEEDAHGFLVTVVMLEHHHLLDQKKLMKMAINYLKKLAVERIHSFYHLLDFSLLSGVSALNSLDQTSMQCREILQLVSRRVVEEDFPVQSDVNTLRPICKVVSWMEDRKLTEQWINKICRYNSTELLDNFPLNSALLLAEYFQKHSGLKLKIANLQMEWDQQLQQYLNNNVSSLISTFFKVGKHEAALELDKIVTFLFENPILGETLSNDVKEDVSLNLKSLLQFCRILDAKDQGIRLLKAYAGCRGIDWCECSLLKQFAMFLNSIGLDVCIGFIGDWLSGPSFNLKLLEKICIPSSLDAEVNLLGKNLIEAVEIQANPNLISVKEILGRNQKNGSSRRRPRGSFDTSSSKPTRSSRAKRAKKS